MRRGVFVAVALLAAPARAVDHSRAMLSHGDHFEEQGGEALYVNICQACHMENGDGAAGAYPSLAHNPKLAMPSFAVSLVLQGRGAMPPLAAMMDDAQVAAVVDYVRTHFGNDYPDRVTAGEVAAIRASSPHSAAKRATPSPGASRPLPPAGRGDPRTSSPRGGK